MNNTNIKIAKNTLFLYLRMFLTMGVSLFTVRVVLNILGIEDFGINNVVGGIVAMFSFLTSIMITASQRFFSIELGRGNLNKLNQYFNLTLICYILIAFIIFIVAESVGVWFIKNKLNIPIERLEAAIWIFHFSVITFIIQMLMIPFNSLIIAKEEMNVYAYISIIEVIMKLMIVYLLDILEFDKLKTYSLLTCIITIIISLIYVGYCKIRNQELTYEELENLSIDEALAIDYFDKVSEIETELRKNDIVEDDREYAVLVGVDSQESLDELEELARACDVNVAGRIFQKLKELIMYFILEVVRLENCHY